jgi:TolB-like protein/DNA-binding winged helix-turn-helix (wHTH) protein/Flp pilus assembly protein TadD
MSNTYHFGQFVLDSRKQRLSRADLPISVSPKAFDVLLFLVQNSNRLVTKEELLQAVWGDTFVEEGNLAQHVSHLRKALGDNAENPSLIVTITRKGYRFDADVSVDETIDTARKAAAQVPTAEVQADTRPIHGLPVTTVVSKTSSSRWKALLVFFLAVLLVGAGYLSWRYFRDARLPKSQKIMLAVLPFENLTGDPGKEYLADGLTEETISQLGRLNPEQLGVIARTSVMGYKTKETRLDQIGRDLSVQYVLENSLRESGDHLRLTAQLIQVKDQTHLWSKDYDYPAKDILTVEDDVANAVAREIQLRLTSKQQAELAQPHPVNPEAFDAYLQGYHYYQGDTDKDADMAAKYFERATQIDPSYALAWAWLSRARAWQADAGLIPVEEGRLHAREAVERALSLNPNLAEAHEQMARLELYLDYDLVGANASYTRALALGDSDVLDGLATIAELLGHFDEALRLCHRAIDLDPLNAGRWEVLGDTEFYMGQLVAAVPHLKKALELNPHIWHGHVYLSQIYILQGRPHDALSEIEHIQEGDQRLVHYALAYYALGRKKEADTALNEVIAKYQSIDKYQIAAVFAFRHEPDKAFEWLDQGYAQHDNSLMVMQLDPLLKNLHNDPRYTALLKTLNLPN